MAEGRAVRGIVDTSVLIDLEHLDAEILPGELALSAITMAELAAGPHATMDADERARRQDRLQRAEATFDPLPIDAAVARAYGRIYAGVIQAGRKARGARSLDLLIAATALAADLPLYTRNPDTSAAPIPSSRSSRSNPRRDRRERPPNSATGDGSWYPNATEGTTADHGLVVVAGSSAHNPA